jgi:hypothetical protein
LTRLSYSIDKGTESLKNQYSKKSSNKKEEVLVVITLAELSKVGLRL